MDRLTRANALIAEQRGKLERVLDSAAWPEIKSMARRYLAKVQHWERMPPAARDGALAELGPNQYGPSIDDVVAQAASLPVLEGVGDDSVNGRIAA